MTSENLWLRSQSLGHWSRQITWLKDDKWLFTLVWVDLILIDIDDLQFATDLIDLKTESSWYDTHIQTTN